MLTIADGGGRGVQEPLFLADVICEQPLRGVSIPLIYIIRGVSILLSTLFGVSAARRRRLAQTCEYSNYRQSKDVIRLLNPNMKQRLCYLVKMSTMKMEVHEKGGIEFNILIYVARGRICKVHGMEEWSCKCGIRDAVKKNYGIIQEFFPYRGGLPLGKNSQFIVYHLLYVKLAIFII